MKIGLVGYQGSGKSTLFELLTGIKPDVSKSHTGQVGMATVPDERFDRLVELCQPKKESPARIELFDTPGLSRDRHSGNAQRLGIIREAAALVHVIGAFNESDPIADAAAFNDDLVLADLQVVNNRIERLRKDVTKPRPDRDELKGELEALEPIAAMLNGGQTLQGQGLEFSENQEMAVKSFALLTRKRQLLALNTPDDDVDESVIGRLEDQGHRVIAAPAGLELEVKSLREEEQAEFAAAMGLGEPCRDKLLRAVFDATQQITFFTCDEKEVHAWLLQSGSTALDAAHTIHSDLARGFIRAEVVSVEDLLRLGSQREVKAAGLQHIEGKDYLIQNGDEIVIRSGI